MENNKELWHVLLTRSTFYLVQKEYKMPNWDWLSRNMEPCGRWSSRPQGESPGHGKWLWLLEGKVVGL